MFQEKIDSLFIVYDKFTKPMAISLKNSIGNRYSCSIWDSKQFKQQEPTLSSMNKIIFLNKKMQEKYLANPSLKKQDFSDGVTLLNEGNVLAFQVFIPEGKAEFKLLFKENWKDYLARILGPVVIAGGVPLATILFLTKLSSQKNQIRYKLLFDAIDKFKGEPLDNFMNGQLG